MRGGSGDPHRQPPGFNEAAGVDPADASPRCGSTGADGHCFNEAAGVDPADASVPDASEWVLDVQLQ